MREEVIIYSGFQRRFFAYFLDALFCASVVGVLGTLTCGIKSLAMVIIVFQGFLFFGYTFYCHGRYGKTLGKRITHLKVVGVDGGRIDFSRSFRRSLPFLVLGLPWVLGKLSAVSQISELEFNELFSGWNNLNGYNPELISLMPWWYWQVQLFLIVFVIAELLTMLNSKKRQTIHDLLGATVVARSESSESKQLAD